jgi:hypothetical protein
MAGDEEQGATVAGDEEQGTMVARDEEQARRWPEIRSAMEQSNGAVARGRKENDPRRSVREKSEIRFSSH